jgi:hypothetical protein
MELQKEGETMRVRMLKKLLLCGILSLLFSSVLAFSATAAVTWEKTFGGSAWDEVEGGERGEETGAVEQTEDGGYIIVASTRSFGAGFYDVYLIKTDANGNEIWSKTFGGTDFDLGKSVQETSNGGYIIVGRTWSFGAGDADFYLIKTDANGNETWSKTFGGTDIERGQSVQETTDGGYIITGRTWSFGGGRADVYLIKTDANGNETWSKTFGGTDWESGNSVQETADGGYIIAGETCPCPEGTGDVYLIKTNANGNETWSKTFGGTGQEMGTSVQEIADGEYIIAGDTNSFGNGGFDVYLIYYSVAQRAMPWIPLLLLDD